MPSDPPIVMVREDESRSNRLEIPTRNKGATIKTKGWSIGAGISRNTSKSQVEKDPFSAEFQKLIIYSDEVETKLRSFSGIQEMRIPLSEVKDARKKEAFIGGFEFIIETKTDLYEFSFVSTNSNEKLIDDAVEFINGRVEELNESTNESSNSALEKLDKLSDLHEKGAITDGEFEEKKSELMDKI